MDSMRKEILRMDPSFVDTWDELKEELEEQCCRNAIAPWTNNEYSMWDPYQKLSKQEGIQIPRRQAGYALPARAVSTSFQCEIMFS
jgi:hypothetical protein